MAVPTIHARTDTRHEALARVSSGDVIRHAYHGIDPIYVDRHASAYRGNDVRALNYLFAAHLIGYDTDTDGDNALGYPLVITGEEGSALLAQWDAERGEYLPQLAGTWRVNGSLPAEDDRLAVDRRILITNGHVELILNKYDMRAAEALVARLNGGQA